jgi:tRNA threonylcarbamoyladenosine modification (KEOPS) complex  Pcc1 subunit
MTRTRSTKSTTNICAIDAHAQRIVASLAARLTKPARPGDCNIAMDFSQIGVFICASDVTACRATVHVRMRCSQRAKVS